MADCTEWILGNPVVAALASVGQSLGNKCRRIRRRVAADLSSVGAMAGSSGWIKANLMQSVRLQQQNRSGVFAYVAVQVP